MSNFCHNQVFVGLGTLTIGIPDASPYFIEGHITLPTITQGAPTASALVVTIAKNGSTFYTGQAGAEGFYAEFTGAVNDSITVTFSSAAAVDQGLNVIKSMVSIGAGQ